MATNKTKDWSMYRKSLSFWQSLPLLPTPPPICSHLSLQKKQDVAAGFFTAQTFKLVITIPNSLLSQSGSLARWPSPVNKYGQALLH